MRTLLPIFLLCMFLVTGCDSESTDDSIGPNPTPETLYFPPLGSSAWETLTLEELGWDTTAETPLYDFLDDNDTKSFIILKDGKIVLEYYFDNVTVNTNWYWASAGKTLTALTLGIAQEEGFLNINDASADYLGQGWSSLTTEQENAITIRHHLTMTTGLDYTVDFSCTDPECLTYLNAPGDFWYYHNAPYTLNQAIIAGAVGEDFPSYYNAKLRDRIGMQGAWVNLGDNKVYFSTARSMARFGLLCLNEGNWDGDDIMSDATYFNAMTDSSQSLNQAYGYLWWLNGKDSFRVPASTELYQGELIPNAPDDLVAGLGANDQKLYVVPSENLVVIRMGNDAGDDQLGPSSFDNMLWEKVMDLIN